MATHPGRFTDWPWQRLGNFKYIVYLPLVVDAIRMGVSGSPDTNVSLHVFVISLLRYVQGQLWMSVTRFHDLVKKHQVQQKIMKFEQLDRESNWEDFIILSAVTIAGLSKLLPTYLQTQYPMWNWIGFVFTIFWHIGPVEFLYYWFHRALHHHYLYTRYHSHHHSSFQTQAVTGNVHPFAEHLAYLVLFGSPVAVCSFMGINSLSVIYGYILWFDFMNNIGHCNWEFMPLWLYKPLKYLVYTPSFHSLHHTQVHANFCLYMPLYDYLYGTVDKSSDQLYIAARRGRTETVDVVFLTHPTDLLSVFHYCFGIPSFAAHPYERKWYIRLLYPLAIPLMLLLWAFGTTFTVDDYMVDKLHVQTWAIPRFNFHYSLSWERSRINMLIEKAILSAQEKGAKVICLGMHNKDEQLNANGALFLKNNGDLKIKVVDGSTLTTAIVVNKIPHDVNEVFLTGLEVKVGRAIASYLCSYRKNITSLKVMVKSVHVFEAFKKSIPQEFHHKLVMVDSLEKEKQCKTWIVGNALAASEQQYALPGTHFYQFTEECMCEAREDCFYAHLPAMSLPTGFKGLWACEGKLPRGVIQGSHAGGIVASLQGCNKHEVGNTVDVAKVDSVMKAALDYGFLPHY